MDTIAAICRTCCAVALLGAMLAHAVAAVGDMPMPAPLRKQLLQHGPWPVAMGRDAKNPASGRAAAVEFGYRMFREPRMSPSGYVACISCHQTDRAFTDSIARARGLAPVERNTPTLTNLRLVRWYGWGGASDSLWMASLKPILDAREIGADAARVAHVVRVGDGLACRYRNSFGAVPSAHSDERVMINVARAIAAFVETLNTAPTRFDAFRDALARGDSQDVARYPSAARRGAELFVGKGQCAACHGGPNFSDGEFHDTAPGAVRVDGMPDAGREADLAQWRQSPFNQFGRFARPASDLQAQRQRAALRSATPGDVQARYRFRTPPLRNVAVTPPYMHDGSVDTLFDAVAHTARGAPAGDTETPGAAPRTAPQTLQDRLDLVAFLETLTDAQGAARRLPPLRASACPRAG